MSKRLKLTEEDVSKLLNQKMTIESATWDSSDAGEMNCLS